MKITGTRSCIYVELDHRTAEIPGELTLEPAFYAELHSKWQWKDGVEVTEEEKVQIIEAIEKEDHPAFRIVFD